MRAAWLILLFLPLASNAPALHAQGPRDSVADRHAIEVLEREWLTAVDSATLDRILAPDFVHPVVTGDFLTKGQHIRWITRHPPPVDWRFSFGRLEVRVYGDAAIAQGIVIAAHGDSVPDRTLFTDVFIRRNDRWRAVSAQESPVRPMH